MILNNNNNNLYTYQSKCTRELEMIQNALSLSLSLSLSLGQTKFVFSSMLDKKKLNPISLSFSKISMSMQRRPRTKFLLQLTNFVKEDKFH
jgi:hypothetical protein